jgi:hypothetical protein
VECESCKQLVVATFAADGTAVRATCPSCGAVMSTQSTPAAPPAPPEGATRAAGERCPKCATARHGERACPSCGLAADKMASYGDVRDADIPAAVRAAWEHVTAAWDDEARHDALWELVSTNGCHAWAAGRYRAASLERPGDPIAPRRIERIRRAAEATLVATAAVKRAPGSPYRATTGILALLIVMLVIGLLYAVFRSRQTVDDPGSAGPDNAVQVR